MEGKAVLFFFKPFPSLWEKDVDRLFFPPSLLLEPLAE